MKTKQKKYKFSKGEINEKLLERQDLDILESSARYIKNYISTPFGSLKVRGGSENVAKVATNITPFSTPTITNSIGGTDANLYNLTSMFTSTGIYGVTTWFKYDFGSSLAVYKVHGVRMYFDFEEPELEPIITNGVITGVTLTNAGKGLNNVTLTVTDILGSDADLEAVVNSSGVITGVTINSGGTGYTSKTSISVSYTKASDSVLVQGSTDDTNWTTIDTWDITTEETDFTAKPSASYRYIRLVGTGLINGVLNLYNVRVYSYTPETADIKLCPFVFNLLQKYLLILKNESIQIYQNDALVQTIGAIGLLSSYFPTLKTAQAEDTIIFTHPDLKTKQLQRMSSKAVAFTGATNDKITADGIILEDGYRVKVSSTGTLPAGLSANTDYYTVQSSGRIVSGSKTYGSNLISGLIPTYTSNIYVGAYTIGALTDGATSPQVEMASGGDLNPRTAVFTYDLLTSKVVNNFGYYLSYLSSRSHPTSVKIEGSNDGTIFYLIDTVATSGTASSGNYYFDFTNTLSYRFYRVSATFASYGTLIGEWYMRYGEYPYETYTTCKLSTTKGGSPVDITDTGTGTHTVTFQDYYWEFKDFPFVNIPKDAFSATISTNPAFTITPSEDTGSVKITGTGTFTSGYVGQIIDGNGGRLRVTDYESATVIYGYTIIPFYTTAGITSGNWTLISGYEDVWSSTRGYPTSCMFFQQRLWFGGSKSKPNTIWGSRVGVYNDFENVGNYENDAINETIASEQIDEITSMYANRGIQVFTAGAEWVVPEGATSPSNFSITKSTSNGSLDTVSPIDIAGTTLFIEKNGQSLLAFVYTDTQASYLTSSMSLLTSLINNPVSMTVDYNSSQDIGNFLYLVMADGTMAVFCIILDQKIQSPVRFETGGLIKNVVNVAGDTYLLVDRDDLIFLEKLSEDKVDMTIVNTQHSASITGLDDYTGKYVRVYNDTDYGEYFVINGAITLNDTPTEDVNIGYSFDYEMISNKISIDGQTENIEKRIAKATVVTNNTNKLTFCGQTLSQTDDVYDVYGCTGFARDCYFTMSGRFDTAEVLSILLNLNYGSK